MDREEFIKYEPPALSIPAKLHNIALGEGTCALPESEPADNGDDGEIEF